MVLIKDYIIYNWQESIFSHLFESSVLIGIIFSSNWIL